MLNCFYIELVNQISFKKKEIRNLKSFNRYPHIVPKTCFQGRSRDLVRTSWGRPNQFLGRKIRTYPERHFKTFLGQQGDYQIRSLGDILVTLEGDVFETFWRQILRE